LDRHDRRAHAERRHDVGSASITCHDGDYEGFARFLNEFGAEA
jgi:hypothetical protein